ncbi:MAG: hypothetical protein ACEPOW_09485 [Bacteroidales bacterium]
MKFSFFKHTPPKRFSYRPRYWDKEKEDIEKRKASLGLRSEVNSQDRLRAKINKKWRVDQNETSHSIVKKAYLFYGVVIALAVYLVFFTDFIYKLIALFGVK